MTFSYTISSNEFKTALMKFVIGIFALFTTNIIVNDFLHGLTKNPPSDNYLYSAYLILIVIFIDNIRQTGKVDTSARTWFFGYIELAKMTYTIITVTAIIYDFILRFLTVTIAGQTNKLLEYNEDLLLVSSTLTLAHFLIGLLSYKVDIPKRIKSVTIFLAIASVIGITLNNINNERGYSSSFLKDHDEKHLEDVNLNPNSVAQTYFLTLQYKPSELVYPAIKGSPLIANKLLNSLTPDDFAINNELSKVISKILIASIENESQKPLSKTSKNAFFKKLIAPHIKSDSIITNIYHPNDLVTLKLLRDGAFNVFEIEAHKIHKDLNKNDFTQNSFALGLYKLIKMSEFKQTSSSEQKKQNSSRQNDIEKLIKNYQIITNN